MYTEYSSQNVRRNNNAYCTLAKTSSFNTPNMILVLHTLCDLPLNQYMLLHLWYEVYTGSLRTENVPFTYRYRMHCS